MKYEHVDIEIASDGGNGQLCCPVCGAVWVDVVDGESIWKDAACEHYMFCWAQRCEPECYNGLSMEDLYADIARIYKSQNAEDEWEGMDNDDIAREVYFEEDFGKGAKMEEVNMILDYTQEFMACGPSSMTVLFGVREVA